MRRTLISFLWCTIAIGGASGQQVLEEKIKLESPVNIGLDEVNRTFVAPAPQLKSAKAKSTFVVDYVNFPEEAKRAFQYAVSIWENNISSPTPINIQVSWKNLDGPIIAQSRPAIFYKNFDGAPLRDVYYPVVLVEKFMGKEKNTAKEPDIICSFNQQKPFYFGTDGRTPTTQYDLVTVALHEIAHGLGISGFIGNKNGIGSIENSTNSPSSYDYYIFNTNKQQIANTSLFKSPSTDLYRQITSDKLNFLSTENVEQPISAIYAPGTWHNGASIYHLKPGACDAENSDLMTPFSYKGEAIHNIGKNTLQILNEIGWEEAFFKMAQLKDFEPTSNELPIETVQLSEAKMNSLQVVFSTDNFNTKDSAALAYNADTQNFEGKLPVASYVGKVLYYFRAEKLDGQSLSYPESAPKNFFSFTIGRDYYPPVLAHNPSKLITNNEIEFTATASDNVAVESVTIEYRINGETQGPFALTSTIDDNYKGKLQLPLPIKNSDVVEYRIIARDNTARKNKKCLPATGLFTLEVFEPFEPVRGYFSDFNSLTSDFTISDFEINTPTGFTNANLHTISPYPESTMETEKYNLIAQLNYPVILDDNGQMSFDEIVLVEPGDECSDFSDKMIRDFVIVEASKNNGTTWHALINAYDSRINSTWEDQFSSTLKSNMSAAVGHENMFWQQTINLTENSEFSAGDTVLFRFRLASDNSVNGWGWAIDNLKIQNVTTANHEMTMSEDLNIYPNPFTNYVYVDCAKLGDQSQVEIRVSDLTGKTVYREINYDVRYNPKVKLDLSTIQPGVYLTSIIDSHLNTVTKRIIKHQ